MNYWSKSSQSYYWVWEIEDILYIYIPNHLNDIQNNSLILTDTIKKNLFLN
jgi:hypothetical protein